MTMTIDRERLYRSLPLFLQNMAVSLEGQRLIRRRYDERYREISEGVRSRTSLDESMLRGFQEQRLRSLLVSSKCSPFWMERFQEFGVRPDSADIFAELAKLPVLQKDEVKANVERISLADPSGEPTIFSHTSGTTGSGLVFPITRDAEREQWGVWWRYRSWHAISPETWCGYFGGRSLVALNQKRAPYWRINRSGRQLMFSAYHLRPETARDYVSALIKHKISWIHGYPSLLALLASYLIDQKLGPLPHLRIITTGAESLLPQQRELIVNGFGVKVFQHYGQAEGAANFSECELGRLHVDEDYSFVEFVPVANNSTEFRVVGTNWANLAFPLIRYDCGDLATREASICPCGRRGRLISAVDGRKEDYLLLPNGTRLGRLDHIFKDLVHIREAQVYQNHPECVVFRVVKGEGYDSHQEEKRLLSEARSRLGKEIRINIEYHERLSRTKSGKLRFVISDIREQE